MIERKVLSTAAVVWAVVGMLVAVPFVASVNSDVKFLGGFIAVVGPLSALLAARAIARKHDRLAGFFFVLSVLTPTVFAWPLNVPALLVGLALVIGPNAVVRGLRTAAV
jgi:hypothetical protein